MSMNNVIRMSGAREAPKSSQSRMDTLILTPEIVNTWKLPPFQRPLRINDKLRAAVEEMKIKQEISGVITLGKLKGDNGHWIVDGQHRIEAFKLSEMPEIIGDVRIPSFDSMAEMADEFVLLNSSIARMRPDDILRGLETSTPALAAVRKHCPFVGYGNIRRGDASGPILSMSGMLRCWTASSFETPSSANMGGSAASMAQAIDPVSTERLIAFLNTASAAWGHDPEYYRLWGGLNLSLCMWMWNRLVMDRERHGNQRYVVLNVAEFKHCLMGVSASGDYLAWLIGRVLGDRDRSPAYNRLKIIFHKRLASDAKGKKFTLPQPAWASASGSRPAG